MSDDKQPQGRSIADIASQYGVTLRALRYYEQRGILTPIRRGTARFYSKSDERRVETIYTARRLGFTVADIASVMKGSKQPLAIEDFLRLLGREIIERQLQFLEQQRTKTAQALHELEQFLLDH